MSTIGPLPTILVFLNDLPSLPQGSKVRFLGCVTKYSVKTGIAILEHAFPPPPHINPTAVVDVTLLLSTMKSTDLQVGHWVNIIGYLEARPSWWRQEIGGETVGAKVQAIMLWSAGGVKLGEYEKALAERQTMEIGKGR